MAQVARIQFEDFVDVTSKETDEEALYKHLIHAVSHYGYNRLIFSIISDRDGTLAGENVGIYYNYPADWMDHYQQNQYETLDPVVLYGLRSNSAFKWKDIEKAFPLTKPQLNVLNMGIDAGLYHGVGVPVRGRGAELAGFGLASSEKINSCHPNIDLLNAYCSQFYVAYKRIKMSADEKEKYVLSVREEEVLSWAARGKTDEEISIILGISKNTVDTHMRRIFMKLGVNGRVLAVVKGMTHGLIAY